MRGSSGPKVGVAVLAAALLVSGMLMGAAYGAGAGITEPQVIALTLGSEGGAGRGFSIEDETGRRTGHLDVLRETLLDAEGNQVGDLRSMFLSAKRVTWQDVAVLTLIDGPNTDEGTVTFMGTFDGFNGESMAVTGGTGAYENVRGTVTLSVIDDEFTYTLHLIP